MLIVHATKNTVNSAYITEAEPFCHTSLSCCGGTYILYPGEHRLVRALDNRVL